MVATIYFAGGEDVDFYQQGGGAVDTTAGKFRSTYARCGLKVLGVTGSQGENYWQNWVPFSASAFWFTGQTISSTSGLAIGNPLVEFLDSSNIVRLRLSGAGTAARWKVEKLNSVGAATQLGSDFTMVYSSTTLDKLDIDINYAGAGTFTVYMNGVQMFTFSGDVTTDGVAALANIRLKDESLTGFGGQRWWSEVIVTDSDTRSMNLQTLAPVANGNTHNFDTGTPAAANVNEIVLNDATIDGSTAAGQIDEYTIPAIAPGTFSILAIGVSLRAQTGLSGGPAHVDLAVRSGGTDYFSANKALIVAFADFQNWWSTDPNTAAAWASLPQNIGAKSVL
jgi:hypothetical protein